MRLRSMLVVLLVLGPICVVAVDESYLDHGGATGTQHNRDEDDPNFYKTNSEMPILPNIHGYSGTHGTYRFMSVIRQTAILIGEPKHGVWRIQDNGHVREYRRRAHVGLGEVVDPNSDSLTEEQLEIIKNNYGAFIPEEGFSAYKYPHDQFTDGYHNYIDLTIYHPKYNSKYDDHEPIDLAHFYCTMSGAGFPHAVDVWRYAMGQPRVNKIGPLGKRAGLDIKENYLNVLPLKMFPDGKLWVNIGGGKKERDLQIMTLEDIYKKDPQMVNYQAVDFSKYNYEVYFYEKPFFNLPYFFIAIVMEHKDKPVIEYIRPDGAYWKALNTKYKGDRNLSNIETTEKYKIPMEVEINGTTEERITYPVPLYGHHHPNRSSFNMNGGACPGRGGDWATYPWGNAGGGWPINYQEITPYCDGFVLDVKCWTNLFVETWDDPTMGRGNAGYPGSTEVQYKVHPNAYGVYSDPYLVNLGKTNEHQLILTSDGKLVNEASDDTVIIHITYPSVSHFNSYNKVPDIKLRQTAKLTDSCPEKCESDIDSSFYDFAGASLTQHNRDAHDLNFLKTNSEIPLLPRFDGYMGSHGTYRFLNIIEQTALLIGEAKHGIWRIQDNGHIREYRKYAHDGLREDVEPNDPNLSKDDLDIIKNDYTNYMPEDKTLYKLPEDKKTRSGYLQYMDLSIYHPKYGGKYNDHEPIDLSQFYCTMSQGGYPNIWKAWQYATKQPMMNKIGPLGKRAGMDIKENYLNVLPFNMFDDGKLWVNVGKEQIHTFQELQDEVKQLVDYQVVDFSKYDYEVYLYERPFFNTPYLFIAIVLEHKDKSKKDFEYIRKDGAYWDGLQKYYKGTKDLNSINTTEVYNPPMEVIINGTVEEKTVYPLPLYGHHHPNRTSFQMTGGACPSKGGDWASYPWGDAGAGWPINYEEVTPLCDGFVLDVKCWINLFVETWKDPSLALGNAGFKDETVIHYSVDANVYGEYTDPYLVRNNKENPHKLVLTPDGKIVKDDAHKHREVVIPIEFARKSHLNDFHGAPQVGLTKSRSLRDYCPKNCPKPMPCDKKEEKEKPVCPAPKPEPKPEPKPKPEPEKPGNEVGLPKPTQNEAEEALKMTYDIAKKVIGLALVLV